MAMRSNLIFWLVLFTLGVLVGERYGLPSMATNITDRGFEMVEGLIAGTDDAAPAATDEDNATAESSASDQDASEPESQPPAPASSSLGHEANADLRMNAAGLEIIKESEGLRLEAYNLGGQWLIGYGHAATARAGMTISEAQAEELLRGDVRASEDGVRRLVVVPMNENQFSAMVSLAYNLGVGGYGRSTVLEQINQGDYDGAANAFLNHNRAGGKVNEHLTQRREKERDLFRTPV